MEYVLLVGQLLLKYGPDVAEEFTSLFHQGEPPKPEQWAAFFVRVRKSGESYFVPPAPAVPLTDPRKVQP